MEVQYRGGALLLLLAACGGPESQRVASATSAEAAPPAASAGSSTPTRPEPPPVTSLVLVSDPVALEALETRHGLDLGSIAFAAPATNNEALGRSPAYRVLARTVARDLSRMRRADPRAGVGLRHAHRQPRSAWLLDAELSFELVAVVNRLDRRPFGPEDRCGQVRLVYRLGYRTTSHEMPVASRLPMTVQVVFGQPGPCVEAASRWRAPTGSVGAALAGWLVGEGAPLAPERRAARLLEAVEVDLQSVRWPSRVRPDLGGHAEYLLRVFRYGPDGALAASPLENTPDVRRLGRDRGLRAELLAWLRQPEVLAKIDRGTAVVPERFLAERVVSVAPFGLSRLANRPFRRLFEPTDFADVDYAALSRIGGPDALLRRLDGMSCAGCHQSRSLAGFHVLGHERSDSNVNAVADGFSPHLRADLERRRAALEGYAAGRVPAEEAQPFAERPGDGTWGEVCGLVEAFAGWGCDEGLECTLVADAEVGRCLPPTPAVGDACEVAAVRPHADAMRDRRPGLEERSCPSGSHCNDNGSGFPGGLCAARCRGDRGVETTCGAIPGLVDFNACLGRRLPFERCLAETSRATELRACDVGRPCRDDYLCARTPSGGGACVPPYFLFQLRVDGHPI